MSNESAYLLRYRQGDNPWQETPFSGDIIIGRSLECDVSVDDEKVSRKHVRLTLKPDGIWLTDLGSSNGTRIGSQTLQPQIPHKLSINQQFFIGDMTFYAVSSATEVEEVSLEEGITEEKSLPEYYIWYRLGNQPWQQYPFKTEIIIGRGSDCDLRLTDRNVSRRHVRLTFGPGGLSITDLGSQNGTRIDDVKIPAQFPQPLPLGKPFSIGGFTLMVNLPESPPPEQEGAPALSQQELDLRIKPSQSAASSQVPVPPPVYSQDFQPPPSALPQPPSLGVPPQSGPPRQMPPRQAFPSGPPERKGLSIWLIFAVGGLVAFLCICAGVLAWFFFPVSTPQPDFAATANAIQETQIAIAGTPVAPSELAPLPTIEISPSPEIIPTVISPENQRWLVMVYGDADDSVLEAGMFVDLDEAELVGSSDRVQIVWQLDRYIGAYTADGDWTTTKRFFVTHDEELGHIGSEEIYDMGEANMSDPNTLVDFAIWSITTYPADKYVLIMSNHGSGWPGGWQDDDPVPDSSMRLNQMDDALAYIISQTSIDKFEIIGFDACLMGQLEVFSMIAPYARYGVASEETEPTLGWPYGAFLSQLVDNPSMSGADLAAAVVGSYIIDDILIVNDYYRNLYTQDSEMEGASADQLAASESSDTTMTAVDLSVLQAVNEALNDLTYTMQSIDQKAVAEARTYAQSYESVFPEEVPPPYLDLVNFARLVYDRSGNPDIGSAVDKLSTAVSQAVISEKHGNARPGSTGFSIYFPNSDLWKFTYNNDEGAIYTLIASHFANISLWDEFMEFHYTGNPF